MYALARNDRSRKETRHGLSHLAMAISDRDVIQGVTALSKEKMNIG